MFELETGATLSEDVFPGVQFTPNLPGGALSDAPVVSGTVAIDFTEALSSETAFSLSTSENGSYYALDQSIHAIPGTPIQPLHFGNVSVPDQSARSVVLRSATYKTEANFQAAVAIPYTEFYVDQDVTGSDLLSQNLQATTFTNILTDTLSILDTWYPPTIATIQSHQDDSTLLTQLGQYHPQSRSLRIYNAAQYDIYYSTSVDQAPPDITIVDSLYYANNQTINIKVDAQDPSGIQRVAVPYFKDEPTAGTQIQSVDLRFDPVTHKWLGSFNGDESYQFYVQVVDRAGNTRTDTNKGTYYRPTLITIKEIEGERTQSRLYLPFISTD